MITKRLTGTFLSSAGASISTNDGATVEFAPNSIKEEGGSAYTGNVNVYATWLDPTAADLSQRMPGDLRGINIEGIQQQLTTYGMIGVELKGDAGEALNILDGNMATIELPVPAELAVNAPATIPLWHFEESTGYWIEDGAATLEGDKYVGTVSHFSFWNCDVPNDYIFIEGTITDENNNLLQNLHVRITETTSRMVGSGWTDQDGLYAGAVPNDQDLIIEILDNCGEVIYTAAIGPFAVDATIPTIQVTTSDNFITVSGSLTNCDNDPVMNGYLFLNYDGLSAGTYIHGIIFPVDQTGRFSGLVNICNVISVETTGYDFDALLESTTTTHDISGTTTLDLGFVNVCDDLTEYFNYHVDGEEVNVLAPIAYYDPNVWDPGFNILGSNDPLTPFSRLILTFDANSIGTYNAHEIRLTHEIGGVELDLACDDEVCNTEVILDAYAEEVGDFLIGSFNGTLENPNGGNDISISGTFKVKRAG